MSNNKLYEMFDNEMVHIGRAMGDVDYKERFSYLKGNQTAVITVAEVVKDVFEHPSKYPFPIDVLNHVADLVHLRSPSVNGFALKLFGGTASKRLSETKDGEEEENKDLEKI